MPFTHPCRRRVAGFTLIELLVVITIIGILAAIALPNYIKAKDKAKEVQLKSAVKSIQVAIERYHVDFEQYPQYLLGGDTEGWKAWHVRYDEASPDRTVAQNAWLRDILIDYNYLEAYPSNPFVDNGVSVIQQTGPLTAPADGYGPGDGDPRFGFRGDTMGCGLEVPIMFRNWYDNDDLNIETERTLLASTNGDPSAKGFGTPGAVSSCTNGVVSTNSGLHYTMGGRRAIVNENGQQTVGAVYTHWPGNFFYRGIGQHWMTRRGWTIYVPTTFVKAEVSRYMMGGYGSYTTEGDDVIRLEPFASTGCDRVYWRFPHPWKPTDNPMAADYVVQGTSYGGLPETCGGGNDIEGPWYPYDSSPDFPKAFIYGAPDGVPDGVVIVQTPGDEVQAY